MANGSFQVSAQELSTILRHDYKPVIFLINNGGYTIERGYLGKTEPYNDIANWAYADLPKAFCPDTSAQSFVVKTSGDLQNALSAPNDTMIFVESIMDPYDAPGAITSSSNKGTSTTGLAARTAATTCSSGRPHTRADGRFQSASRSYFGACPSAPVAKASVAAAESAAERESAEAFFACNNCVCARFKSVTVPSPLR